MSSVLRYGADASVSLEFPDGVLLAECGEPTAAPVNDLPAAVSLAWAEPLDFPPLRQCTIPGDRVVVALGEGVPRADTLASAMVHTLLDAGVHADGITVLRTVQDAAAGVEIPNGPVLDELDHPIALATHDPDDRDAIALLAATDNNDPILLNRLLTDADVVLPIGCLRHSLAPGYHGVGASIFPTFSDRRTLTRFTEGTLGELSGKFSGKGTRKHRVQEADHVGWLLGVAMTLQVVPGPGDRVLHLLAGEVGAVRRRGRKLYDAAWHFSVPRRASLVVAGIEGDSRRQTWHNMGRALAAANALVEDDGAIALCCEIDVLPDLADTFAKTQLDETLRRARVYLLSQLDESRVEDLDMVPIAQPDELVRLVGRHDSCILLSNAPHALVSMEERE